MDISLFQCTQTQTLREALLMVSMPTGTNDKLTNIDYAGLLYSESE